jgi:hypothetical protein
VCVDDDRYISPSCLFHNIIDAADRLFDSLSLSVNLCEGMMHGGLVVVQDGGVGMHS